jgi:hypothetical protein
MALLSISTLLAPATSAAVRAKFVSMLQTLSIPADQWRAGGVASTILTITSITYANFTQLIADGIASGFLGTATGGWLTLLAFYVYNVTRTPATFASGAMTFTNTGGGIYSFAPGGLVVQNTRTNKTYANTATINIAAGSLSVPTVVVSNFQALTAGSPSNANPGDVTTMVTSLLGVTCTNVGSLVGLDEQSDASVVAECQAKLGSLTVGGPSNAYQYAVDKAVNSVTGFPVNVNRRNVQTNLATGVVNVTVASPSGPVVATDITGIINSIVDLAVPDAVSFFVASAAPVNYSPTITIWAQGLPGVDAASIASAAADAITAYIEAYPIGGLAKGGSTALWATGIDGAIKAVSSAIFAVDGATDLPLFPAEVAVDAVLTPTVNLVAPP